MNSKRFSSFHNASGEGAEKAWPCLHYHSCLIYLDGK